MAALPYMQFYVADYLADTTHLTAEEHGAYMLLLFSYWQTGKPLRIDRLATVARIPNERWPSVADTLSEFFHVTETHWVQFRVEADLEAVNSKVVTASNAGKASARAKALKKQQELNDRSTNVDDLLQRNGNHKDTDTDTDKNKNNTPPMVDDLFPKFWKMYPNKKGKAAAEKAWKKLKVTADLFGQIAEGLAAQVVCEAWVKDGGQFIPHPATWLNGKRWEDEVKVASNVHPFPQSRHTGFADRDYTSGLKMREDGSYAL
ncbi:YdaU family protein [Pseudomonas sp. H1_G08]